MKKIFSIIIPVYNCKELLAGTLESVISQDKSLFECIVVDGGSTDGTVELIREYEVLNPNNITYISEKDEGVYDAMNKGIAMAAGDYLYFLGAGDVLIEQCLSKIKEHLNYNLEIIYGNAYLKNILTGQRFGKKKIAIRNICHQAIFYNKEIFRLLGKYSLKYSIGADYELNIKVFSRDEIKKNYVDIAIARYLGEGISETKVDYNFFRDLGRLIIEYLGEVYYDDYFILSGSSSSCECKLNNKNFTGIILNSDFMDFLKNTDNEEVMIFGTSNLALNIIEHVNRNSDLKVKCFIDNDIKKQGKSLSDRKIIGIDDIYINEGIPIIIASSWYYDIKKQLIEKGIPEKSIILATI